MQSYIFEKALVRGAWQRNVLITVANGLILSIEPNSMRPEAEHVSGAAIPAMANIHSHAFQRGFAGEAEKKPKDKSDFWSWRQAMYNFVPMLSPEGLYDVARGLYMECVLGGYSRVTEFHYLHHADVGLERAMAEALITAANDVGVGITLLPVAYNYSGFGKRNLEGQQKGFSLDLERMQALLEIVSKQRNVKNTLGLAVHSLRAIDVSEIGDWAELLDDSAPIHIHIAEQMKEVEDCLSATGKRPVELLNDHITVDQRWCLIHATHLSEDERQFIATSGATVGLCPTTEANLGDGLFPLPEFLAEGGRIAIGSDSNVCRSAAEELRLLEYGQRLTHHARTLSKVGENESIGEGLWQKTAKDGHAAMGSNAGEIAVGKAADIVVLDDRSMDLAGVADDSLIDSFVFAGTDRSIKHVMVAGDWVIKAGKHIREGAIRAAYVERLETMEL